MITSQIYVTKGKTESLLGKEDTIKLGILKLNQDSEGPEKELRLRCIRSEILKDTVSTWSVTGGKPQNKIDAKMAKITTKHEFSKVWDIQRYGTYKHGSDPHPNEGGDETHRKAKQDSKGKHREASKKTRGEYTGK